MKKSYKLLSIYLDREAIPSQRPQIVYKSLNNLFETGIEYNLFDYAGSYERYIYGSTVLSAVTKNELLLPFRDHGGCSCFYIVLDYWPDNMHVLMKLYFKRILQAMCIMTEYFGRRFMLLVRNKAEESIAENMLNEFYKSSGTNENAS